LQVIGFLVISVVAALLGRRFVGATDTGTSDPNLNLRANRFKGRTFVLSEAIIEGAGRVRIDDTVWQVRGRTPPRGRASRLQGQMAPS
jgi:membrane protein implicated in regulation of membrane protease activity